MQRVLHVVEHRALFADRVDWPVARDRVLDAIEDRDELHARLRVVVRESSGAHGGVWSPSGARDRVPPPRPSLQVVDGAGVLRLPRCEHRDAALYVAAGSAVLQATATERWVIDLRGNTGGSMWPMLAVAAPLLRGDGDVGFFVDRDGGRVAWRLRRRTVWAGRSVQARRHGPRSRSGPVAVLTDGRTASSGEAVAVAFRGLPDVRSYGAATWGFSTANTTLPVPGGALALVTTARFADRTGQVYDEQLVPDVATDDPLDTALDDLA